jgi:D-beta-D-heptose 7-phosphate kinase/D-beta-D-heptose 1-phosphate adenosyltransferase
MKKIFVNGTFDILHAGHLALLFYARSLGDSLTVAIDSDQRVRSLKGSNRPINSQSERAQLLAALKSVDQVEIFNSDEELCQLIARHDLMVKGSDYRDQHIVGKELIDIVFFDKIPGYSSSEKIQDIINRR